MDNDNQGSRRRWQAKVLNQVPKLIIGEEAAFCDRASLYRSQYRFPLFAREGNAQLRTFQANAVQTTFLAEDNSALGVHQFCRIRLDGFRQVELAGDRAALPHEKVLADNRFPRFYLISGQVLYRFRDFA